MDKNEFVECVEKTLKEAGWKSFIVKRGYINAVYLEQLPITGILVVNDASGCDCRLSMHDDALRISGKERSSVVEFVNQINENSGQLQFELFSDGYVGCNGHINWSDINGEWKTALLMSLDVAVGELKQIEQQIRNYKERRLADEAGKVDADSPVRFVTDLELCSWLEGEGIYADLSRDDVILLHDIGEDDETIIERQLTIEGDDSRLYWEAWCPNWKLNEKELERAVHYANEWNNRNFMSRAPLRVDVANARFVWLRVFDFYWVRSEQLMNEFGERLLSLLYADVNDVELAEREFNGRQHDDVSGLPLFAQK